MGVRVKVCCIADIGEAEMAVSHGASALGLVSEMPSGPGVIPEERIAEIAAWAPREIDTFLLTSLQDPDALVAQQRRCGTTTLQLCDTIGVPALQQLRSALPDVSVIQVIHVIDEGAVDEAVRIAPHVDGILLDSGDPGAPVKELGGTGRRHDWSVSRRIRDEVSTPVYLAGGLNADNIGSAIDTVRPYAVDICSGLRTDGALDARKLSAFMAAVGRPTAGDNRS